MANNGNYPTCIVCGAVISDENLSGIGFGCMANIIKPAKMDCFKELKSLELYIAKAKNVQSTFIETFKNVKFRSDFKKSFYESMKVAERISKKQIEIMKGQLFYQNDILRSICEYESFLFKKMIQEFQPYKECPDLYREKLEIHKKLYLSGKKNQKFVIKELPRV